MERIVGIETEYGFYVDGVGVGGLVDEARAVVQSGPPGAAWHYGDERPRHDQRGFQANRLNTNPDDERIDRASRAQRPRTPEEEHVDRVLANGARLYHDHGHPEYATPECRSVRDLVAHDRAGMGIVWNAAQRYRESTGRDVSLYKNNTDYHGMSYGTHENYLVGRSLDFEQLAYGLIPFLATRTIYTGAGKVGAERGRTGAHYQLSQRAEFFDTLMSVDTLHRRPLVNTRDEPHARLDDWRRLHVICSDANLSEWTTALKMGTTALVLDCLEAGYGPPAELKDPIRATRAIARNPEGHWFVELADSTSVSAVELQRAYLLAAQELTGGRDPETDWILAEWEAVLDDLDADITRAADRVDWIAKKQLLDEFIEAEGLDWADDIELLRSVELEYHSLDPDQGLFWALEAEGGVQRLTTDEEIASAMSAPPLDTRAAIRAHCLANMDVTSASWGRVHVQEDGKIREVDLRGAVDGDLSHHAADIGPGATADDLNDWLQGVHATG
mgnify:FL=1